MHLFIYEFVTAGGWYSVDSGEPPPASLAIEGRAMLEALLADLASAGQHVLSTLADHRLPEWNPSGCRVSRVTSAGDERRHFQRLAAEADWTLVIAPEFQALLAERTRWVDEAGGRLLGAGLPLVELASDKHRLAEHLANAGIATPKGCIIEPGQGLPADWQFPAVIKPIDGVGSIGIRRLVGPDEFKASAGRRRLERFCPGLPASISCLCGTRGQLILPACEQLLTADGTFRYLGGRLPLAADLDRRARRLAEAVLGCLPRPFGYLGIDLVLGDDPSGRNDAVIEVNPRLTTSYLGLRSLARGSLAAVLLALAEGKQPFLEFDAGPIQFDPAGEVRDIRS